MKRLNAILLLAANLSLAAAAFAQNENTKPSAEFFRIDFSVKESESGKLINTRNYQMMVKAEEPGSSPTSSIRSGAKVPITTGEKSVTYVDVGVNIDVRHVKAVNDGLTFEISAEINGALEAMESSLHQAGPPLIRTNRLNSIVAAPFRKTTVMFMTDDPGSKRQIQLDVTAAPVR